MIRDAIFHSFPLLGLGPLFFFPLVRRRFLSGASQPRHHSGPIELRDKSFPTGKMSLYEKRDSGNIGNTFTGLSRKHVSKHHCTKIDKVVGWKVRGKMPYIAYNYWRKEGVHNFLLFSYILPLSHSLTKYYRQKSAKV